MLGPVGASDRIDVSWSVSLSPNCDSSKASAARALLFQALSANHFNPEGPSSVIVGGVVCCMPLLWILESVST